MNTLPRNNDNHSPVADTETSEGFADEMNFWRAELSGQGQFGKFIGARLDPDLRHLEHPRWMDEAVGRRIESLGQKDLRMLDLGSGPVSTLGWLAENSELQITAADPLGDKYCALLDELKLDYPLRPVKAFAEELVQAFGPGSFEFVHSRNALDHAQDVGLCFQQIKAILKPGGLLFLEVFAYEGAMQSYDGLHQFNFSAEAGNLVCRNRNGDRVPAIEAEDFEVLSITPTTSSVFREGMAAENIILICRRK